MKSLSADENRKELRRELKTENTKDDGFVCKPGKKSKPG